MPQNHESNLKLIQQEYRARIFNHFETMMANSQKVISSGFDEYQGKETDHSYPVDAFIKTDEKIIAIETCMIKRMSNTDILKIIHERFQPLSEEEDIIAIIDSKHGYDDQVLLTVSNESYPLILAQETNLISTNSHITKTGNGLSLINRLFSSIRNNNHHTSIDPLDQVDYDNLITIINGRVRTLIYLSLLDRPKYGSEIAKEIDRQESSVYRALDVLEDKCIVECLNPCGGYRKYYHLTIQGMKLRSKVQQFTNK